MSRFSLILILAGLVACNKPDHSPVFELIFPDQSGIDFANNLIYDEKLNAYTYRNFYNGAGVALGDINNDGLLDIYFCGNQVENKLYMNKGNFEFEDITDKAGVACAGVWSTGVSMADVNGDGWLDIFVCKSGPLRDGVRHNELFINNGDSTFTESAEAWGVADEGLSLHAVFFDYDRDGDLDFYLLNNSNRSVGIYDLREGQRQIPDPLGGNKFYRNDGDHFTDVTQEVGIYSSAIGFGLGVSVSDVNKDGWPDLFVSNDFFERDYLYINNKDGTFTERLEEVITEISMGSMGADIADLDNDGFPEIFVTEMLPEKLDRIRTKTIFEDWNRYTASLKSGYYHQFSRNVLQRNMGYTPGSSSDIFFTELARYSNVQATDWSWGALLFDYNNDGLKDIFVANGIAKDLTDQDYINFYSNTIVHAEQLKKDSLLITNLMDRLPSQKLSNYLFRNRGDFDFENVALKVGLDAATFSNGAAYGDLDNDGAIDLVINNINDHAYLYRNRTSDNDNKSIANYLAVELKGSGRNTAAIGAQVTAYAGDTKYYVEQAPVRGYLSSVSPVLHFGLGRINHIDSLVILWPRGGCVTIFNVNVNQRLLIKENESSDGDLCNPEKRAVLPFLSLTTPTITYTHREKEFVDFDRDRLLFEMINDGVAFTVGDVNNDGLEDIYIGGSADFSGSLFIQQSNGDFMLKEQPAFQQDRYAEDTDAVFFDANGDGYLDLYVASGGKRYPIGSFWLIDRLYFNDGKGNFNRSKQIEMNGDKAESTSFVRYADINADGKPDLLVGSRSDPFNYGAPVSAYILFNQGGGVFLDVTKTDAPGLHSLGMLRDAVIVDLDRDNDLDIIIATEWSSLHYFRNDGGKFINATAEVGLDKFSGQWNALVLSDINNDGFPDIIAGNMGLNGLHHADDYSPLVMYMHDFDGNGNIEQIVCKRIADKDFPLALYPDITRQLPILKKRFTNFSSYKNVTINDLFDERILSASKILHMNQSATVAFINEGGKRLAPLNLPWQAQLTSVYAILAIDINMDGNIDLLLGGNQSKVKPEWGSVNSTWGITLLGKGDGTFIFLPSDKSGFHARGEIRTIKELVKGSEVNIFVLRKNDSLLTFKYNTLK